MNRCLSFPTWTLTLYLSCAALTRLFFLWAQRMTLRRTPVCWTVTVSLKVSAVSLCPPHPSPPRLLSLFFIRLHEAAWKWAVVMDLIRWSVHVLEQATRSQPACLCGLGGPVVQSDGFMLLWSRCSSWNVISSELGSLAPPPSSVLIVSSALCSSITCSCCHVPEKGDRSLWWFPESSSWNLVRIVNLSFVSLVLNLSHLSLNVTLYSVVDQTRVCVCLFVCAFRGDVTGQRDAAPLQADGLPGPPAAPHGRSRGQEGGLAVVGRDAQGRTCRICWGESRRACVLPPSRPLIVLCINLLFVPTRRPNCCMSPGTSDAPAVSGTLNLKAAQPKCFFS